MSVVLADPLAGLEDTVDGRVRRGGPGQVFEDPEQSGSQMLQAAHGVVPAPYPVDGKESCHRGGTGAHEPARLQHQLQPGLPRGHAGEFPRAGAGGAWKRHDPGYPYAGTGRDAEFPVRVVARKEVTPVPEAVHEFAHRSGRIRFQREVLQGLAAALVRTEEQGHNGSPHGCFVPVDQLVLDAVDRGHEGSPSSRA